MKKFMKENKIPITMWLIFETVAITLFLTTSKLLIVVPSNSMPAP